MAAEVEINVNANDNFSGVLGNFGSIMTGIESVVNLVGQAFDTAVGVITPFINSASESEQAVARLDGVLRATGGAVGLTSDQLQNMADGLQSVTRFSDETILNGEAILLTFRNIGSEMFERTVPAMVDMAEIFGSVDSAAMQLGKALNDPVAGMGALSRAGITFSEDQKEMIKSFMELGDVASAQNIILSEVEAQVGGLSKAMGETFSGQVEIAKNKIDSIKESIGGALLPVLGDLLEKFMEFADRPEVIQFFDDVAVGLGNLADDVVNFFSNFQNLDLVSLTEMFSSWAESIDWQQLSQDLAEGISNIDWGAVGNQISTGLMNVLEAIETIMKNVDWGALTTAILHAIADAFAGLAGFIDWGDMVHQTSVVAAYEFKQLGIAIVEGIRDGILWAWGNLKAIVSFGIDDLINWFKSKLGIASPSAIFFNIARDIVQGLINGWASLIGAFQDLIGAGIDAILELFAPFLALFGIEVGSTGGGTTGGDTGGGSSGGGSTSQVVNNYYYGPVYFGATGEPGQYVDCPSPNPLVAASGNQLVTTGF